MGKRSSSGPVCVQHSQIKSLQLRFLFADELIRQTTVSCAERGLLLLRVRDELQLTLSAYQALYESSVAFGVRKALQAEQGKANMEKRVSEAVHPMMDGVNVFRVIQNMIANFISLNPLFPFPRDGSKDHQNTRLTVLGLSCTSEACSTALKTVLHTPLSHLNCILTMCQQNLRHPYCFQRLQSWKRKTGSWKNK